MSITAIAAAFGVGVLAIVFFLTLAGKSALPEIAAGEDEIGVSSHPDVEENVVKLLAEGKQSLAEELLNDQVAQCPKALRVTQLIATGDTQEAERFLQANRDEIQGGQRIFFLLGACIRSRFDKHTARLVFHTAWAMNPKTPSGKCALCMMRLDSSQGMWGQQRQVDEAFAELRRLVNAHPEDVVLPWMLAVQCRSWDRNAEGALLYKYILTKWKPGPVLVHQTYANLLDELGLYKAALKERYQAVKMEPAPWSYDGLGNTLDHLGRFKEAQGSRDGTANRTEVLLALVQLGRGPECRRRIRRRHREMQDGHRARSAELVRVVDVGKGSRIARQASGSLGKIQGSLGD